MRSDICGECGQDFVWDSDAGSAVCMGCGNLQDPNQVLLDAHIDTVDKPEDRDIYRHTLPTRSSQYLKGSHSRAGWTLAGESKRVTHESNKNAMRRYTSDLARYIGYPALTTRVQWLFEQAMERGSFRYGRKARLLAGSCLAIALREEQKGVTIRDIAYRLDETPTALARVLTIVLALLDIKLTSLDPSWHLPVLQKHVLEILVDRNPTLPQNLISVLKSIHLPSALRSACSLSELVSHTSIPENSPSTHTACAVYILALEGEALISLPHCGELAETLGRRLGISKGVVMRRYKVIYGLVGRWATDVPWLAEHAESGGPRLAPKPAKRQAIARCLKDVVQYHEGMWKTKLEASGPLPTLDEVKEFVSSYDTRSNNEVNLQRDSEASTSSCQPRKKRKLHHADEASQFLISPLVTDNARKTTENGMIRSLDIVSHMLTSDSSPFSRTPTRLQLMAVQKPAGEITDDELFADNELEGYLRTKEEKEALIQAFDWAREKDDDIDPEEAHTINARRRDYALGGTSRINIEALNCLLNDTDANGWVEAIYEDDDDGLAKNVAESMNFIVGEDRLGDSERKDRTPRKHGTLPEFIATIDGEDGDESEMEGPCGPLTPGASVFSTDSSRNQAV